MSTLEPLPVDPFDLADALGTDPVVWQSIDPLRAGASVTGSLLVVGQVVLPCDLLAVDEAFPAPVASEPLRTRAHQAWRHGEVEMVTIDDRLTLLVPGQELAPETVMDAVGRFAKAVGAAPSAYSVQLRLGR